MHTALFWHPRLHLWLFILIGSVSLFLTWINKTGEFWGKECWRQGKIPELRFPVITISIIALNVLAFMRELIGGDDFVTQWSVIPADIVAGRHLLTVLTSMVMHASWSHIIGNMIVGRSARR
jgi:membrane associated rhomboid family serine protease